MQSHVKSLINDKRLSCFNNTHFESTTSTAPLSRPPKCAPAATRVKQRRCSQKRTAARQSHRKDAGWYASIARATWTNGTARSGAERSGLASGGWAGGSRRVEPDDEYSWELGALSPDPLHRYAAAQFRYSVYLFIPLRVIPTVPNKIRCTLLLRVRVWPALGYTYPHRPPTVSSKVLANASRLHPLVPWSENRLNRKNYLLAILFSFSFLLTC